MSVVMSHQVHKNILAFLFSAIGLMVLPHVYNIPVNIFAFFYLLLGWRLVSLWHPHLLPSKLIIFLLTVLGIALLFSHHSGIFGRDAGTRLFLTALGLKLMEIKGERDLYLVTFLAFIVAASQFLYQQSLLMGGYILIVSCVLLSTLVSLNSYQPKPLSSLKTSANIVIQSLPIAIVLFLLVPRLEAPRWELFENKQQAKMGLSDHLEPGAITDLAISEELAFRVKFTDKIPPPEQRYWRGPVLTHTDGKRWTEIKNQSHQQFMDKPIVQGTAYEYTLLMEPQEKNWVFGLDLPVEFSPSLSQNANLQLITSENPDKRTEYKITSFTRFNTGFITHTEFNQATQLPGQPSERIKRLVQQLHGYDSPPQQFINQLLKHFRKEDFHYTLTPPAMEENPIETFLFETRYGFCSHYAAAFVYLMRVANIPARIVTGYQGGEFNKIGDFLEVRQSSAHAWAEVWLEKRGWVRFDPTAAVAPERIEQGVDIDALKPGNIISFSPSGEGAAAAYQWLKQARQLWSHVDYNWQHWVINYNTNNQAKLLSSVGANDIKKAVYWMMASIGVITLLLSWMLLYQKPKVTDKALRIYRQFCKKLAKHGLSKEIGEGETAFAERVKSALPDSANQVNQITQVFIKLRYGRAPCLEDVKQFTQLVRDFKV